MSGEPSYVELGVPDVDRAHRFYGPLLNWTTANGGTGPGQVDTQTLSIGMHGGDDRSLFEVFFTVADLDAALAQVPQLGGQVLDAIHDDGDFGRWAPCVDDQGVRFGLRSHRPGGGPRQ